MKFRYRVFVVSAGVCVTVFLFLSTSQHNYPQYFPGKQPLEGEEFHDGLRVAGESYMNVNWKVGRNITGISGNTSSLWEQLGLEDRWNVTEHVRILVHARMRTGSSVTGGLFNDYPDFFFVYEPGHMLVEDKRLDLYGDSFEYLEKIRPDLVSFMDGAYNCNFTGRDFYLRSLQRHTFMRQNNRALRGMKLPIKQADLKRACKRGKHVAVKTVRLNSLRLAEPALRDNAVRVVHVVRDPRGMMPSRRHMQRIDPNRKSSDLFHPRLERVIRDYCKWLEDNYVSEDTGPEWLRKQYFLLRYEDLVDRQLTFVPKLFRFAGLPLTDDIRFRITSEDWWKDHGEAWRTKTTFKEALRIQEICGESVFTTFGYKLVHSEIDLSNMNVSLLVPL